MGVDLYYCKECRECVHSDDFRSCLVCFETGDICDMCDDYLLLDFPNIKKQYICEHCIIDYKNIDFESEYIKDFIDSKKTNKDEILSVLKAKYDDEYSPDNMIIKLQEQVQDYKNKIKELNLEIKKLKKKLG
jgi:hypothetical protein